MASKAVEVSATGVAVAGDAYLKSVTLTAGSDLATLVVRDGAAGPVRLTLKAAANTSTLWVCGDAQGASFGVDVHATLTGTGPVADLEFE